MSVVDLIFGRPLATNEQEQVKMGPLAGVPAMGLDALTSSAYGPEAALTILLPVGLSSLHYIGPITFAILALLAMLYFSYRQTIAAYPCNGGSYTVARENLGVWPGLLAASALMLDYVLNVAVGISAGVAALVSAAPALHHYTLVLCLCILVIITVMNLRGTGEAGLAFALPTYLFIVAMLVILGVGTYRAIISGGHPHAVVAPPPLAPAVEAAGIWIVLRAFAAGCTAMTGVEAVSNGVTAFRQPAVKNAHRTLTMIVVLLAIFLAGIAFLVRAYHIGAMDQGQAGYQSILSQLAGAVLGRGTMYYIAIASVLATLCLSANTSFVGFPRLCRLVAREGFLPQSFTVVGRRLVYSVGIGFLTVAAGLLLIVFGGITDRLIPLFAVGAFLAFTLSQTGMVMHWRQALRDDNKGGAERHRIHVRLWINGIGALATGVALAIILAAKFIEGAWITVIAVPVLLGLFKLVHHHYARVDSQVAARRPLDLSNNPKPVAMVPAQGWNRLTEKALRFGMWLADPLIAVHISNLSGEEAEEEEQRVSRQWKQEVELPCERAGVPAPRLRMVQTPFRHFLDPLLRQIDGLKEEYPGRQIAVIVPEVVERHWWEWLLHRRKPNKLIAALRDRCDDRVIVVSVPWYLEE